MEIGKPWSNITISRSLSSLKFFYDLKFGKFKDLLGSFLVLMQTSILYFCTSDAEIVEMAWGVDIEPVLAMVSLAFGMNFQFYI